MKFKKLLFLGFCATLSFNLLSQNVKNDGILEVSYVLPPTDPLLKDITHIYVQGKYQQDNQYINDLRNMINQDHYTLLATEDLAQANLVLTVMNKTLVPRKTRKESSTSTDKEGKTTISNVFYTESKHQITLLLELLTINGEIIGSWTGANDINISGQSTKNYDESGQNYDNLYAGNIAGSVNKGMNQAFFLLESQHLYAKKDNRLNILTLKSKKVDYSDINTAAELVLNWGKTNPTDLSSPEIIKAIGIYEAELAQYEEGNKKARVNAEVAALCEYMLSIIHFKILDYVSAYNHIQISETLDKKLNNSQEITKRSLETLKTRGVY